MANIQPQHLEEQPIVVNDFRGGLNLASPATMLQENQCAHLENMYLDPASGKPRTRYAIGRYSNTATGTAGPVDGLTYWNSQWILSDTGVLYYLDGSLDPVSLGALSGSDPPTFCPYNDKLIVASGGALQYTSGNPAGALATLTNAPSGSYVFEKYGRVVSSGDSSNPDRVYEAGYHAETTWTSGGEDYADVGWKDGLAVIGIKEWFEGTYLVFKRGSGSARTYYMSSLSETAPTAKRMSNTHCPISHRAVVDAVDKVFMLEAKTLSTIVGTDKFGELQVDVGPGINLGSSDFTADSAALAIVYPAHFQIWVVPNPSTRSKVYVYHYLFNAWSTFTFGTKHIHSAFYNMLDGYLYLGMNDGCIWKYDTSDLGFQDYITGVSETAYTSKLKTRVIDPFPRRELILKDPQFHFYPLEASGGGTGTIQINSEFGETNAYSDTFTIPEVGILSYNTRSDGPDAVRSYDTQLGGSGEMRSYMGHTPEDKRYPVHIPLDDFQFEMRTSSAIIVEQFSADVALGQRAKGSQ